MNKYLLLAKSLMGFMGKKSHHNVLALSYSAPQDGVGHPYINFKLSHNEQHCDTQNDICSVWPRCCTAHHLIIDSDGQCKSYIKLHISHNPSSAFELRLALL
jgi:hypothetical protein